MPTSIQKQTPLIQPSDEVDSIIEWFERFDDIKFNFIDPINDISRLEGRDWINKTGWKKIAHEFGLSVCIDQLEYKDEIGYWRARAMAVHPSAERFMTAVAMAQDDELVIDRAVNRAVSDMVAAGRVSAEEIL